MMFHSRAAERTIVTCSALSFMMAALGDHARAGGYLDASYTISFARIRVGEITAAVVFGDSEYTISARGRAGGVLKLLMDGEGSFTTRGTIKDDHPVPTTFTSTIVSNAETSDVTMVLDEGSVKEPAAVPPPTRDLVPVTEANRQGIIDPLTAMLFSTAAAGEGLSQEACRHTLPIFDGRQRYDLKLAFKRMDRVTAEKGYAGPVVVCSVRYEAIAGHRASTPLVKYLSEGPRNGDRVRAGRRQAPAGSVPGVGGEHARQLGALASDPAVPRSFADEPLARLTRSCLRGLETSALASISCTSRSPHTPTALRAYPADCSRRSPP
jgi:hypothetical protein